MTKTDVVIDVRGLTKSFVVREKKGVLTRTKRTVTAVEHVDLQISRGETVGFIGANGAGKSTTIKMLTGILSHSSGSLRVLGMHPLERRAALSQRLGVVFGQRSQLWWDLPLVDSFTLLRHMYRLSRVDYERSLGWLTEVFDLGPLLRTPVRQLSLGQRMRGELTAALLHEPELVFLDEPTIGLDVVSKQAVRDALRKLNQERETTVILTTHDLADIAEVCKRVVIIDHGRIIEDGPLAELLERLGRTRTLVVDFMTDPGPLTLKTAEVEDQTGTTVHLTFDRATTTAANVLAELTPYAEIRDLATVEPDIDQIIRTIYRAHN